MKAAVLSSYGGADKFTIREVPDPELNEGQILICNMASSVNPVDTIVRSGKFRLLTGLFSPPIVGSDFCGTVLKSRSMDFKEGDEVYGFNRAIKGGAYAELLAVDGGVAALKPTNISFTEAASLPLVATTAWQALVELGKIKKGHNVLINGCTGGVGSAAVQIAKTFSATVTGVCNGKYAEYARALGCDKIVDYKKERIPGDVQYDLIFDAAGKLTLSDLRSNLAAGGYFVTTKGNLDSFRGILRTASDLALNKHMRFVVLKPATKYLDTVRELVEHGQLRPTVHQTMPLQEIAKAHKIVEEESFTGKIAIQIG